MLSASIPDDISPLYHYRVTIGQCSKAGDLDLCCSNRSYLQTLRIERAKELLESSNADFDAITERVGYGDASSFRRLFKRMTGVSPAQYRRQCSSRAPAKTR